MIGCCSQLPSAVFFASSVLWSDAFVSPPAYACVLSAKLSHWQHAIAHVLCTHKHAPCVCVCVCECATASLCLYTRVFTAGPQHVLCVCVFAPLSLPLSQPHIIFSTRLRQRHSIEWYGAAGRVFTPQHISLVHLHMLPSAPCRSGVCSLTL